MNPIVKTYNLDQFNNILGNRILNEKHVRELMRNIKQNGYSEHSYGKVNEKKEIIDGAHRLEALRRLRDQGIRYPFYYIKAPNTNLSDCIASNELQKNWDNEDYVNAYAVDYNCKNRDQYVKLKELRAKYRTTLSLTALCAICMNGISSNALPYVRTGRFMFLLDFDEVVRICDFLSSIKEALDTLHNRTVFIRAIVWAISKEEINHEALRSQINKYYKKLDHVSKIEDALRQLSFIYHYNDRRAKKLTPIQNFYSIYDAEIAELKVEKRRQNAEKKRAYRQRKKEEALKKASAIEENVLDTKEKQSIDYSKICG
jgi:hypothetical protein